jgi:hypothetical protein
VANGEPIRILEATVRSLTTALEELTRAHVRCLLEGEGPSPNAMQLLQETRNVQRLREQMAVTLENAKWAWTSK